MKFDLIALLNADEVPFHKLPQSVQTELQEATKLGAKPEVLLVTGKWSDQWKPDFIEASAIVRIKGWTPPAPKVDTKRLNVCSSEPNGEVAKLTLWAKVEGYARERVRIYLRSPVDQRDTLIATLTPSQPDEEPLSLCLARIFDMPAWLRKEDGKDEIHRF